MNLGIYRSWHGLVAAGLVGALLLWHATAPQPFGSRDDARVGFLLTTGWLAVALYVALALYAVRRAAHRLRLSPEFAWRAQLPQLERAQSQLRELQNRVARRETTDPRAVRRAAREVLVGNGVQRVLRIRVERDPQALGALRVVAAPREPLGRLAGWLHAHVYYGFAAALVVWFHGGMRCGTTMGLLLNVLSYFVIGTGALGALLWTFGPTWLLRAERELSLEKAFALRDHFARKLATADADAPAADLAALRGQRDRVEREWRRLSFYRTLLRGWRLVHVPCSVLLLGLVAVHVLSIWYY